VTARRIIDAAVLVEVELILPKESLEMNSFRDLVLVLIFPGALLPTLGQRALGLCGGAAAASLHPSRAAA
jgi:hypothetical protein